MRLWPRAMKANRRYSGGYKCTRRVFYRKLSSSFTAMILYIAVKLNAASKSTDTLVMLNCARVGTGVYFYPAN
jgi:hypothetical protein